jgi:1,4-dihydroxy-2-naphthoate octaprenyltransferase
MPSNAAAGQPVPVHTWMRAIRVPTLPAAIVPVLVGTAAARSHFRVAPFIAALLASVLIQIGTNLANDYFDYRKGADTAERLGPMRVTQSGLIAPATVKRAALLTFSLAALVGLYLVTVGGWPILAIGLLSIAAGALYTGGPWPFGYHGLGDPFVFIFFGVLAVTGTAYLYLHRIDATLLVVSLPVGLLVTAILVVNNLRDIETDAVTGKHTLAVMLGPMATRVEFVLLVAGAYLVPLLQRLTGHASNWFWLPWLSLPLAVIVTRTVLRGRGRALNAALRDTARLHLLFGVLFALSLLT